MASSVDDAPRVISVSVKSKGMLNYLENPGPGCHISIRACVAGRSRLGSCVFLGAGRRGHRPDRRGQQRHGWRRRGILPGLTNPARTSACPCGALRVPSATARQERARINRMFGLMRRGPRLPYCGTCKTLGAVYGHPTRLLLNHDVAFLSEVLLDVGGVPLSSTAYRSFNCLTLPRKNDDIPVALQYAAAVTVALAYFRMADHRRDATKRGRRLGWALAARALSRQYLRAAEHLRSWRFPLDEMCAILATQPEREASPKSLAYVAEPTMLATALVFSHGVHLAGRPDRVDAARRLGYSFGELIYLLDAFEDRERDARAGDFNPLLAFPRRYANATSARDEILAIVACLEREMTPAHAARLRVNVEERLGLRPRVVYGPCRQSIRDRAYDALAFARALRNRENAGLFKGASIMASVAVLAFVFPDHARRTESWQECLGVSMNLMALGAVFAAPPPTPSQYPLAQPDRPGVSSPNCWSGICGQCKEGCAESCLEGICDSACDS